MTADRSVSVGARIRAARLTTGLSQGDLGGNELSASYVSLIEADKRMPTAAALTVLAERLGTTIEFLRDGVDPGVRQELTLQLQYAELALHSGEAAESLTQFEALVTGAAGLPDLVGRAAWGRARALEATGQLERATALLEDLREQAEVDPAQSGRWAEIVIALCRCYSEVGDLSRAIDLGESAMVRLGALGLEGSDLQAQVISTLLGVYHSRGDHLRAQLLADALIAQVDQGDSRLARGAAYWNAALVAEARGRLGEAIDLAERALAMYAEGGSARAISRLRVAYAWLLLRGPEPDLVRGRALLEQAHAELVEFGAATDVAQCDTELARVSLLEGDAPAAIAALQHLLTDGDEHRMETIRGLLLLGEAQCVDGRTEVGLRTLGRAAEALSGVGSGREAASSWRETADLLARYGDVGLALPAYQRALELLGVTAAPVATPTRPRP